jgi:Kef-type K+ transport system membrane component KefB
MMDDVVGLVMVQIIPTLGAGSSFTEITVIRPVFVSIAFAVLIPLICLFVAKPVMQGACDYLQRSENAQYKAIFWSPKAALVYQTAILLAMVTGSTYAGTSNLFAAYLAGAAVTWLGDSITINEREQPSSTATASQGQTQSPSRSQSHSANSTTNDATASTHETPNNCTGRAIYEHYYSPAVESLLRPLFFASIGFAIPITKMFSGRVVWRGLVYTILMVFAKLICGLWLVRFAPMPRAKAISKLLQSIKSGGNTSGAKGERPSKQPDSTSASLQFPQNTVARRSSNSTSPSLDRNLDATAAAAALNNSTSPPPPTSTANTSRKRLPYQIPRPKSLYPAAILGSAMVSRGEIGFLISSVAEANGVFGEGGNSEEFLVVTWAILLCTLIGPVTVGLLVKRVKRLQQAERRKANGLEDPLGIWGVLPSGGGARA